MTMVDIPSSSFIPKQNTSAIPTRARRRRTLSIFGALASLILFGSIALTGGTYAYKMQLEGKNEAVKKQLNDQKELFNEGDIATIESFNRQLSIAKFLMANHAAPSKIFEKLEQRSLGSVQYASFSYENDPAQSATLTLTGGTEEFKSVALQAIAFGEEPMLKDAVFGEISTGDAAAPAARQGETAEPSAHTVSFTVEGILSPSLLGYEGRVETEPEAATDPVTETVTEEPVAAGDETITNEQTL